MDPTLQNLSVSLSEAALRNAAAVVASKISATKATKQHKATVAALEDIINELLADKSELIRIAQAFEDELVAQRLSSDDVEFITKNLLPVLRQLMDASGQAGSVEMMDAVESILSTEVLTIMQLIGFNYREAIGKPLTDLVAAMIASRMPPDQDSNHDLQEIVVKRDVALAELARDPESWSRLSELMGRSTD
ncbi:MAG: hypothetical protein OXH61_03520 [Acidimicrobiaceae bacterium]|nr:hypothetical protein [Acidimicrobiaceae bacterium]